MIRVKFLSRHHPGDWERYFPDSTGCWGGSQFIFERDAPDYDWLVVHDDVPPAPGQRRGQASERLRCPRERTLLLTTEPESIKTYGRGFCAQFGAVITSQPAWALPHPQRHYQHAGNLWFYGLGAQSRLSRQALLAGPAADDKREALSVVHSPKRMRHTAHAQRHALIEQLRAALPAMRVYGRNAELLDDKAQALAPFRYHLAVENHIAPHHITEKLTDALLGRCLCFYAGAPNAADYFPAESFIPIDIHDPAAALATIRSAMANRLWEERREAIEEARRLVLEREHLFAIIDRVTGAAAVGQARPAARATEADAVLLGRHAWRRAHPLAATAYLGEKFVVRLRCRASASSR